MKYRAGKGKKWLAVLLAVLLVPLFAGSIVRASESEPEPLTGRAGLTEVSGRTALRAEEYEPVMAYSMESSGWAYGNQLEGNALQIYNTLVNTGNMAGISEHDNIVVKLQKPVSSFSSAAKAQLREDIERALDAYKEDHGEYFWIWYFDWIATVSGNSGWAYDKVQIVPRDYYSGIRGEIGITNAELNKAIRAVQAQSGVFDRVKAAHDYTAELITYNSAAPNSAYSHTITGGLLGKYQHKAVCECYAKVFKLLCNAVGVPCIQISGGSGTDAYGRVVIDHMWNYVQMDDGLWYLVDVTWDDMDEEEPYYNYFLAGTSSVAFDGGIVSQDHLPVGLLGDAVYEEFILPKLAQVSYWENGQDLLMKGFSLKNTSLSIDVGQGRYVETSFTIPTEANGNTRFTYSSSNPSAASVNANGYISGRAAGRTVITVSSKNNPSLKATCTVTVSNHVFDSGMIIKAPTTASTGKMLYTCTHGCGKTQEKAIPKAYVKLNASSLPLQVKKSTKALKVTGYNSLDKITRWRSSNKKVATVSAGTGKITAKKTGTAKITVETEFGAKATCRIKVQKGTVKTKKLTPTKKSVTIRKGKSYTVKVVRSPLTATDKLTYTSSNKKVATVSTKGKVTAKKKGRATITVRSAGGRKTKVTVKVS